MRRDRYLTFAGVPVRYQIHRPLGKIQNRVLLIPSPLLGADQYARVLSSLLKIGCLCVCCDYPGFGPEVDGKSRVGEEDAAKILWGLLDEIDRGEGGRLCCWHLIGHGLSGRVIFRMVRMSPDSVASITLICPYLEPGRFLGRPSVSRALCRMASARSRFAKAAQMIYGRRVPEKEWLPLRRAFIRPGVQDNFVELLSAKSECVENGLFAPKMVLWGGRDSVLGGQIPEKLKKLLPDGEFHTLPTAGHVPMYTNALAVQDYLRGWLRANGS